MKHYFGYTRVSTLKQGEKGVSLQEQHAAIENYARRNGLNIAAWFQEKETAAKRGRPVFTNLMRSLERGEAAGLIVHKIDRSARNLKDWADLGELIDKGVEIHFANESLDLHTRGGRLSADIQAVVAADYIRNLREETRKGFYGRIKQGFFPLPAPLGYLDAGKAKPKIPDPVKAPLIKKAFELYASGKYTLDSLKEELEALGLKNRHGGKVSKNGLAMLLKNPFYIGLISLNKTGEIFQGAHVPLISKSLFDQVQGILSGKGVSKIQKHDFLFRRMLTCKYCEYTLIGEMQKGNVYYRCHTKDCPTIGIREDIVEESIVQELSYTQIDSTSLKCLMEMLAIFEQNWNKNKKDLIASIELNQSQLNDRLRRITDAYIDGVLERDLFEERKTELLMQRKGLEDKIAGLKTPVTGSVPDEVRKFLELTKSAYVSFKMGTVEQKRDLLKILTSNRYIEGKNVELQLKNPFVTVAEAQKNQNGGPYRIRPRTEMLEKLFEAICEYFKTAPTNILPSLKEIISCDDFNLNDDNLAEKNNLEA
ncbi:MAG: recombinase family protein [Deltaproteobacteria bacterium]|nr:recombinase family protein [Deltaproteobacteria bacterium]